MTAWFIIQFLGLEGNTLWSTSGSPDQPVGPFPNDVANYWIKGKGDCFPLNPLPTCDLIYHWQATFKENYLLVYTPDRVFRMCVRNFDLPLIQLLQHGSFSFKVDSPQFSLSLARGDVGSNSNGQWHSAERHKEQGSITALVVSNGSSGAKVQEQVDIQMVFLYHFRSLLYGRSLAALNWSKAWSSLSKSWYSVAVLQDVTSTWLVWAMYMVWSSFYQDIHVTRLRFNRVWRATCVAQPVRRNTTGHLPCGLCGWSAHQEDDREVPPKSRGVTGGVRGWNQVTHMASCHWACRDGATMHESDHRSPRVKWGLQVWNSIGHTNPRSL